MLFLAIVLLITSLSIAGVAAYFSVVGLSLLFVGSGISIIIIGIALEVGKLVAVTTLKQLWGKLNFLLKVYLFSASVALSIITSIGIYGFLSNGYNTTSIKVHTLEDNRTLIENRIVSLKEHNKRLESITVSPKVTEDTTKNRDTFTQQHIDLINQKQKRIDELTANIEKNKKTAGDERSNIINALEEQVSKEQLQIPLYNNRLQILDKEVQTWLDQGTGGMFKQNGLDKARVVKESQQKERDNIDIQIKNIQKNIDDLRSNFKKTLTDIDIALTTSVKNTESLINKLEQDIALDKQTIIEKQKQSQDTIEIQQAKENEVLNKNAETIKVNEEEIGKLTDQVKVISLKINDTDVGTFKFVAKNFNLELDKTVNWFILMIICVFDPLAVILLLCFNSIIGSRPNKQKELEIETSPALTPLPSPTATVEILQDETHKQFYEHDENNKIAYRPFKPIK